MFHEAAERHVFINEHAVVRGCGVGLPMIVVLTWAVPLIHNAVSTGEYARAGAVAVVAVFEKLLATNIAGVHHGNLNAQT